GNSASPRLRERSSPRFTWPRMPPASGIITARSIPQAFRQASTRSTILARSVICRLAALAITRRMWRAETGFAMMPTQAAALAFPHARFLGSIAEGSLNGRAGQVQPYVTTEAAQSGGVALRGLGEAALQEGEHRRLLGRQRVGRRICLILGQKRERALE